jgi:hypothetical protein
VRTRWIVVVGLAVVGFVWIGQGVGLLRGSSFMVGDPRWAVAGVVLVAGAGLLGWTTLRKRRRT